MSTARKKPVAAKSGNEKSRHHKQREDVGEICDQQNCEPATAPMSSTIDQVGPPPAGSILRDDAIGLDR